LGYTAHLAFPTLSSAETLICNNMVPYLGAVKPSLGLKVLHLVTVSYQSKSMVSWPCCWVTLNSVRKIYRRLCAFCDTNTSNRCGNGYTGTVLVQSFQARLKFTRDLCSPGMCFFIVCLAGLSERGETQHQGCVTIKDHSRHAIWTCRRTSAVAVL
jgi:hypothetical protein